MIRHISALSLFSVVLFAAAAQAGEPISAEYTGGIPVPASTLTGAGVPIDYTLPASPGKGPYSTAKPSVSFAMCGVEAYGADTDLDAGLIDYNVPDPARAAGASPDEQKDVGRNARDFHSSVVLGVTVGYHF